MLGASVATKDRGQAPQKATVHLSACSLLSPASLTHTSVNGENICSSGWQKKEALDCAMEQLLCQEVSEFLPSIPSTSYPHMWCYRQELAKC